MNTQAQPRSAVRHLQTLDSLGAAQGVAYIQGQLFAYGDREVGVMRAYTVTDTLKYLHREYQFTVDGKNLINHPTGIAWNGSSPTFVGNTVRLNKEGTQWKAVIHAVDWDGLMRTKTLDGNLLATIEDDACIQGTRPEYVRYKDKWMVATADYGPQGNEVRLYDPEKLLTAKKTSEKGVLIGKFSCSPWVQNLHWIPEKGMLVLVQNQIEGRRWRLTFLNLEASMESGEEAVVNVADIDRGDELEGFTLLGDTSNGVAISSSRKNNAALLDIQW
ncbi:hypothetical protein [Parapedobacter tibetensis]|uniref:hypothetical protein n=1 Tax=Parapedobacter tibetensis TaxID=2972951 RepID=UPI00214DC0E2|nr:hypothetical protein [Parapedobacter tibetensis]